MSVSFLCQRAAGACFSQAAIVKQPILNWYGQGESDCLLKTKHCEIRPVRRCRRNVISAQCSECQREEIQAKRESTAGVTMTLLR